MPLIYLVNLYSIKQYIANLLILGKHFMYISKQESNFCFWLVTLQSQCQRINSLFTTKVQVISIHVYWSFTTYKLFMVVFYFNFSICFTVTCIINI